MVIFIDDLNMPQREKYFAQPPIELLRQWMDHGGWYERKPPCPFRTIVDTQFVAAMGPPGGGRNPVTNRLLRHFNFISFTEMSDSSVSRIFTTILGAFFRKYFGDAIQALTDPVVTATVRLYNSIRAELLPTPTRSHYTFNLRDLSKVVQGVMRADPRSTGDSKQVLSLWLHECSRVFEDRLINDEDHGWFRARQEALLTENFGLGYGDVVTSERLIFGDFMVPGEVLRRGELEGSGVWGCTFALHTRKGKGGTPKLCACTGTGQKESIPTVKHCAWPRTCFHSSSHLCFPGPAHLPSAWPGADPRVYSQITDMPKLVKVVEEYLEDYNSVSSAPMKLVMFLDAIEHVSRITR